MSLIRNNFSFHYNTEKLLSKQVKGVQSDDFSMLLGHVTGNTLYISSEASRVFGLLDLVYPYSLFGRDYEEWRKDNFGAYRNWQHLRFHDLIVGASHDLGRFLNDLITAILEPIDAQPQLTSIFMDKRPTLASLQLPFLVRIGETGDACD